MRRAGLDHAVSKLDGYNNSQFIFFKYTGYSKGTAVTLIEHAEKYLGEFSQGWKDESSEEPLQIASVEDCPDAHTTTFMSLGLSDHVLDISESKTVRHELIFSVYSMAISSMIVSFLLSICEAIAQRGKAVLRGEIIPLSKELADRIGFCAVYCAIPVFFDDDFASYIQSSPATVMVWILPIHRSEAEYIKRNGWESFEDLLEDSDPDLFALNRAPIV